MSLSKMEMEPSTRLKIVATPEGMARVIYSKNPFDTSQHTHEFKEIGPQLFLSDTMSKETLALPEESTVASINGDIIQRADWDESRVGEGDVVVVFEVPGGGDDDSKSILRLVAMIVVVIASQGAAAAWGNAAGWSVGGVAQSTAAIAFTVAGGILVNAIIPPVAPDAPTDYGFEDSRSYGIDGAKNTSDEGAPLPVCYGPFRMAGNVINFHTRNQGNDQYLYLLLNAGEGVSAGLTNIELNEQDIEGFLDAEVEIRLGDPVTTAIDWFADTTSPTSVATSVTTSFQTRTTGTIDSFRLDFVAPQGLVEYRDDGNRLSRTVVFDIEYKKTSEPTTWTTLTNQGVVSSNGVLYRYFAYNTYDANGDYVSTIPEENRADFRDAGDYVGQTQSPYSSVIFNVDGNPVGMKYRWPSHTAATQIRRAQTSAVRFSFYSPTLDEDTYDIRVRRTTVESTDPKIRDAITWTDYNEIVQDDVLYRHTALLGLKIRLTDQLSSFPTVTYLNSGRIIKFWDTANQVWASGPSTNPAWITYDIFTNGRFGGDVADSRLDLDAWVEWGEYCDNEGLVFQGVFDTKSNLWDASLHVFRAGHARPIKMGTKYSVAIDRATAPSQMFTVGNIISGSFNQKWLSLTDRANEIELNYFDEEDRFKRRTIKVYDAFALAGSPQNTATATMYGIVDATRAAEEATYMLKNNRYLKSTVTFKSPSEAVAVTVGDVFALQHDQPAWAQGGRLETGSTTTSMKTDRPITFDGAKSYKFMVRYDSLIRQVATITAIVGRKVSLSGLGASSGVNRLQLTSDNSVDRRITRVETDTVWVDDVTGLSVSDSVDLIEIDAIEIRDVVAATSGDLTTIPLATALPSAPSEHFIYMSGEDTLLESEWRVTKIDVDKDLAISITGATYDERIYDWTPLTNQPAPDTGQSRIVPHVINLDVVQGNVNIGGILRPIIDISWDLPADFEDYGGVLIELNEDGAGYRFEKIHRGELHTTVEYNHDATVDVRVIAMSVDGRFALNSTAPEVTGLSLTGDTIAPAVPTSVAVALGTLGLHVSWVNPVDIDYAGSDIKRNTSNDEPGATLIFTTDKLQVAYDDVIATNPALSYYYWVRSVDNDGNSSAWVASTPTSLQPTPFADGADATTGWLTNEQHGITADADGGNPVFSGANGEFKVWKGTTEITAGCTFSVFAADNLTGTINTALDTPVTGAKGYYEVTAETSAQDVHSFVVRAVTADTITIDRVFTVTKNKAGTDGSPAKTVILSAESQTFSYDKSSGTPVLIGPTSIALTVNEQNTTGSTTWAAWDDTGAAITPVSNLLSSVTDAGATILESAFDAITNNDFVKVRATREGIYDEISIHNLGSGVDGLNKTPVFIYQRTAADSAPTLPSLTATYTFATGAVTNLDNGWTDTIPSFTGSNHFMWITKATAEGTLATDDIAPGEWQNPAEKLAETGADGSPGTDGDDGFNTATLTAYKRSASAPTDDPGVSITYTFDGASWTPGNGWTYYIPAGTDPVYGLSATAYATTPTDEVLSADWSSPELIMQDGTDGAQGDPGDAGLNVASVYVYQRTTTDVAPTKPSVTANYTFATGNVTGLDNGWTDTIPARTGPWPYNNFLWVTLATASSINATDDILTGEWQTVRHFTVGGTDGYNTATLNAFKKQSSAPTDDPGAVTYTFDTAGWTPGNGWLKTIPLGNNPVFVVSAVARSQEPTDDIAAVEWSAVSEMTNVSHFATAYIYQRTATDSAPTLPSVTATFTFATGAITNLNNGWTDTIPAAGSNPFLWISLASAKSPDDTDDILNTEWQAAVHLSEDGAVGNDGYNAVTLTAYKRASSAPTDDPGASITYTFATAGWTPGNSWLKTIPAGTDPLYALSATAYSQSATDDVLSADWSSPALILQDGAPGGAGDDGLNVATAYIYQRTATDSAPTKPSVTANFTFATGNITGLNNGWTDTVPAASSNPFLWISLATASSLASNDDILTGEWQAPQHLSEDGSQGDPGDPGDPGQEIRTVNIYRKNSTSISSGSGTFADPLAGNTSWSYAVPALTTNGDYISVSVRTFTDDGLSPQDASWSAVARYSERVDGAPGDDGETAITGFIEPSNGLHWTRAPNGGAWTPSGLTTDLDVTFMQGSLEVARLARRMTLTSGTGVINGSTTTHKSGSDFNTGRVSVLPSGSATTAMTYQFTYGFGGVYAVISATVSSSQGGDDGTDGDPGTPGDDGLNVATVYIYKRTTADVVPAKPTTASATYTFATGALDALNNGWTRTVPPRTSVNDYLWISFATASNAGTTDEILAADWQTAVLFSDAGEISGNALNIGRGMSTLTKWSADDNSYVALNPSPWSIQTPASPPVWPTVLQCSASAHYPFWSEIIPIDPTKKYRLSVWAKEVSGTRNNYLACAMLDSSKNLIASAGAVGWAGNGTYLYWARSNQRFGSSWTKYTIEFGGDAAATYPTGGTPAYLTMGGLINHNGTGTGVQQFNDFHITELAANGVAGVDGLVVAGVRKNTKTFAKVTSNGDMYIHGFDVTGAPSDSNGSMIFDGDLITLPKDYISTSQAESQGYIVFANNTDGDFIVTGGASNDMAACRMRAADTPGTVQWQYDNNSTWVDFTPQVDHLIIGTYRAIAANIIGEAAICAPMVLSSQHITAGKIEVANLSALTSIIGQLDTRTPGASGSESPRLRLSNTDSPIQIFRPSDDSTVLFGLTEDTAGDLVMTLVGDFAPGTLNTADGWSNDGIDDLSERLGLTGGGAGGYIYFTTPVAASAGPTSRTLTLGSPPITSSGKDIKLAFQFTDNDSGIGGGPGVKTRALWTIKWRVSINGGGYADVSGASFSLTGAYEEEEHPYKDFLYNWSHFLTATRSFTYSTTSGNTYAFALHYTKTAGDLFDPIFQAAYATEPSGADIGPNPRPVMFVGSGSLTMSATTAWKTMDLTTEYYDDDNGYSVSVDVITIVEAGDYIISYTYGFHPTGGATNDSIKTRMTKNGTTTVLTGSASQTLTYKSNTRPSSVSNTFMARLAAADTIRLQQACETGTSGTQLGTGTNVTILKVR